MPSPSEKLAVSLAELERIQRGTRRVFASHELSRVHRERLERNGVLRRILGGWLLSSSPGVPPGDTTAWYASFWEFCELYCSRRFGRAWQLSPEQSLLLHTEDTAVPDQVVIYAPAGTNHTIDLLFGTSLFDLRQEMPPPADLTKRDGLRLFTLEAALTRLPQAFYQRRPIEAKVALASLGEPGGVLRRLLDGGQSLIAGRLAGAFRAIGRHEFADEILTAMRAAGYDVRESNPLSLSTIHEPSSNTVAPIVLRLRTLWEAHREPVVAACPPAPGPPGEPEAYMRRVDEVYATDAYHSLSIEGYRVTPALIERMRSGSWNPDEHDPDGREKNALAASGYWQAFGLVRSSVADIIAGTDGASVVRAAHRDWYRALFQPCVSAGVIPASTLAGYRGHPVFLRGSRHVPPRSEVVSEAMQALFGLLEEEPEPVVRAVLGHWLFGYVHPFPDGNGRVARFVMNAMLATGGYPWTVIRVDDRDEYMCALESASVHQDIGPFARFVAERIGVT